MMADRHFLPAPGPFATLDKYIDMASELSEELGCAAPLFNAAKPYFLRAIEEGIGEEDISAVIKLNSHQIVGDLFHRYSAAKLTDVELNVGDRIEHRLAVLHQARITAQKQGSLALGNH